MISRTRARRFPRGGGEEIADDRWRGETHFRQVEQWGVAEIRSPSRTSRPFVLLGKSTAGLRARVRHTQRNRYGRTAEVARALRPHTVFGTTPKGHRPETRRPVRSACYRNRDFTDPFDDVQGTPRMFAVLHKTSSNTFRPAFPWSHNCCTYSNVVGRPIIPGFVKNTF